MLKIVNIKEQYLVMMSSVADISYGFQLIDEYIPLMQERIKRYAPPLTEHTHTTHTTHTHTSTYVERAHNLV
jgi:hypothetical protein